MGLLCFIMGEPEWLVCSLFANRLAGWGRSQPSCINPRPARPRKVGFLWRCDRRSGNGLTGIWNDLQAIYMAFIYLFIHPCIHLCLSVSSTITDPIPSPCLEAALSFDPSSAPSGSPVTSQYSYHLCVLWWWYFAALRSMLGSGIIIQCG